ncbi:Hypothetical_protein [Hexamita inflata]|uniref:Hypothetical_protein n=1 Tax=Hexamita inflata TaxID=28002 RepID=A0AA86U1X5_9EUKA|nr:Hypothetical protein HINF_LOCUS15753 [Hexamita inflata]
MTQAKPILKITVEPINTAKKEYSICYQQQILTMYEQGMSFDEIKACKYGLQGISIQTIYKFLDKYKIPKRIKKAGKIYLPVALQFCNKCDNLQQIDDNTSIENVEQHIRKNFDTEISQYEQSDLTCPQSPQREINQFYEAQIIENYLYEMLCQLETCSTQNTVEINPEISSYLNENKQYIIEDNLLFLQIFSSIFRYILLFKAQQQEKPCQTQLLTQYLSNYLLNEPFSKISCFRILNLTDDEEIQLSNMFMKKLISALVWDDYLYVFINQDNLTNIMIWMQQIKINSTVLAIEQIQINEIK